MPADENFIVIQGWMVNDLELKGNELLAYALIYGFSQDGESEFTGSLSYLVGWFGFTKKTAITTLQSLVDKGLVEKTEDYINGVKHNKYKITPVVKKLHHPGEKITPNNIKDNKDNIKKEYKERKFVIPSVEEIKAYCEERNNGIDPQYFWDFYDAKGWKIGKTPMKSWKSAVRTWEAKRRTETKTTSSERDYSEFYI